VNINRYNVHDSVTKVNEVADVTLKGVEKKNSQLTEKGPYKDVFGGPSMMDKVGRVAGKVRNTVRGGLRRGVAYSKENPIKVGAGVAGVGAAGYGGKKLLEKDED
jgi:hypothetical protein